MSRVRRQTITGIVVSDKMDKTVVVRVETLKKHPRYKKYIRRRKKYKVHDENNESSLGDVVRAMSTRPLSKGKRWRLAEIVEKRVVSTLEIAQEEELVMKKEAPPRVEKKEEEPAAEAPEEAEEAAAEVEEAVEATEEAAPETGEAQPEEEEEEEETEEEAAEEETEEPVEDIEESEEEVEPEEESAEEPESDDTGSDKTESS